MAELWAEIVKGADVILGALLGAGSAFVASFFADRRRFKREDQYRDYTDRRQAYADFLASMDLAHRRASEGKEEGTEERQEYLRRLGTLELIGSDKIHTEAMSLTRSFTDVGTYLPARLRFILVAREDLGKEGVQRRPWQRRMFGG